jgi:hypothetical protein
MVIVKMHILKFQYLTVSISSMNKIRVRNSYLGLPGGRLRLDLCRRLPGTAGPHRAAGEAAIAGRGGDAPRIIVRHSLVAGDAARPFHPFTFRGAH